MKPTEDIEKLIKNIEIDTNARMDQAVLDDVLRALEKSKKAKSPASQPSIWRIIAKSPIIKIAAIVVVALAVCLLTVSDRGELEQQQTNGPLVAMRYETPAELVSVISLNMVFRDGNMEAMEKQFDKAENKVKPGLKTRLTVEQLIRELERCEKI